MSMRRRKRRLCETLLPYLRGLTAGPVIQYKGHPLGSIRTAFRNARDRAGLSKDVSPYTLRHTLVSEMRKRGVPVWEAAGFLGHSSGYKTTERYAKFGPDHLSQATRAIDAYFADLLAAQAAITGQTSTPLRASCVRANKERAHPMSAKPLSYMVEPDGIEPTTSTMPL